MLSESNSPKFTCNSQPLKVRFAIHSTVLATLLHVSIVRFLFAGSSSTSVAIVWGVTGGQLPAMTFEEFRTRSSSKSNNNSNTRTTTTRAATTSPRFVYFVWFIVTIFGFCVLFAGVRYIVVVAAVAAVVVAVAVASVAVAKKAAHTGQSAKSNTPLQFDTSAKRVKGKNDRERERGGREQQERQIAHTPR